MTAAAVILSTFVLTPVASATPPVFVGPYRLTMVSDSVWGHCDMVVVVNSRRLGEVTNDCRAYDGPVSRKTRPLTREQVGQLSAALRQADVFGPMSAGSDLRGLDAPLITLRVEAEGRSVEFVCLRNLDFEKEGPRKRLLDLLTAWFRETYN